MAGIQTEQPLPRRVPRLGKHPHSVSGRVRVRGAFRHHTDPGLPRAGLRSMAFPESNSTVHCPQNLPPDLPSLRPLPEQTQSALSPGPSAPSSVLRLRNLGETMIPGSLFRRLNYLVSLQPRSLLARQDRSSWAVHQQDRFCRPWALEHNIWGFPRSPSVQGRRPPHSLGSPDG